MSIKLLAALFLASASLAALPAVAADNSDYGSRTIFDRDASDVLVALQARGINATHVEEWGTVVCAFVEDGQGRTTFHFFQPDGLESVKF